MSDPFDVAVIGGGVNGCGIARDCALRGLRTLLLEQEDFGAGATGGSSGMLHGGLRYLLHDVKTTRKSCLDSGYIQQICPHLIWRIPLLMPLFGDGPGSRLMTDLIETYLEAYDRFAVPLKHGRPHCRLTAEEAFGLEPGLTPRTRRALTFDEWGIDAHRLCLLNALSAREAGATVRNHAQVEALRRDRENGISRLDIRDTLAGTRDTALARIVVNATGPWLPRMAGIAGAKLRIRPGKGVHVVVERRVSNLGVVATAVDGRQIFILPHDNYSIIGTTDDDYYGDPDDIPVTGDEVEYLLEGIESVIPGIRRYRLSTTWAAIRPTLFEWGTIEDALSRDHEVIDHATSDGVDGLLSLVGGKLAAYRLMAEEATDAVLEKLRQAAGTGIQRLAGANVSCRTATLPLPGGDLATPEAILDAGRDLLDRATLLRLYARYGSRAREVLDRIRQDPRQGRMLCPCEPVLEAEVHFAVEREQALTLGDVRRRTRLGTGACQGAGCAEAAAAILRDRLGWDRDTERARLEEFHQERWRRRRPVLDGAALAQEELGRGARGRRS